MPMLTASDFIAPMATCRPLTKNYSLKLLSCMSGKVSTYQTASNNELVVFAGHRLLFWGIPALIGA